MASIWSHSCQTRCSRARWRTSSRIGEAAACVAGDLRERHPLIPWAQAKGMRNIVVHHYFGVAWDEVWRTATLDIPILRGQIVELLRAEFPDSNTTLES